ncbi:MAG: hypothetical protein QM645_10920 [Asticcacaulis sp.]
MSVHFAASVSCTSAFSDKLEICLRKTLFQGGRLGLLWQLV